VNRRQAAWTVTGIAAAAAVLKLWDTLEMPPPQRRVRRVGTRGPRVLCLHGLFGSGAFWLRFAHAIAARYQVVIPDLLGFGASPKPADGAYTIEDHLAFLQPLLEEPGDPWIVVGHSMGCSLTVATARHDPARVRAAVLFNAPVYSSADRRREIFGRQNLLTRASTRSRVLGRIFCEASCLIRPIMTRVGPLLRPDLPPEVPADYFRHRWQSYDRSFRHLVLERDLLADLAAVPRAVAVAVIQGADDPIVDQPGDLSWPANVHLEVVPGGHTTLLLDRAEEAGRLFGRVLAALGR
jgi:pimeloyl-ACP methyl ester carboxylesterase